MYKFRVILDSKKDVIREIAVMRGFTLEELHQTIINAFEFDGLEMASFYHSDLEWNQGEEIPLFNMNEQVGGLSQMSDYKLEVLFTKQNRNLIYVYDFMNLWTFFVEFVSVYENKVEDKNTPLLLFSLGNLPKEAPKKEFEVPSTEDEDDDDFYYDDYDSFYQ